MGLQRCRTHALELDMIAPYTMAFSLEFRAHIGIGAAVPDTFPKQKLDVVTKNARERARALINPFGLKRKFAEQDSTDASLEGTVGLR